MNANPIPAVISNWIDVEERPAAAGESFHKLSPHTGLSLCAVARSGAADVDAAVKAAARAQSAWAGLTPVRRGELLQAIAPATEEGLFLVPRVIE